jgi:hypothetical protein
MPSQVINLVRGISLLALLFSGTSSFASSRGLHLAITAMALGSSTRQGGQGPSGSSLMTHSDLVFNFPLIGIGMFLEYDAHGTSQTDLGYGPKAELHLGPFYVEAGYTYGVKRSYTDRSIAADTGTGWIAGIGVRIGAPTAKKSGSRGRKGWFFQAAYRYRNQTITKQDGVDLGERINQYDGYPTIGFGYLF